MEENILTQLTNDLEEWIYSFDTTESHPTMLRAGIGKHPTATILHREAYSIMCASRCDDH